MVDAGTRITPPVRAEFEVREVGAAQFGEVERPLSAFERVWNQTWIRRLVIVVVLALAWEIYGRWLDNPLMFPPFHEVAEAFYLAFTKGPLLGRMATTLQVLFMGYGSGLVLAAVFTTLAVSTRFGNDLLSTLTAMFNPLPAIALLPLALLWFGLGIPSLVFVIVHSVLWAVALNTHTGFKSVSETLRMAGTNYGLRGVRFVTKILIPAAFPSILAGLKIGWAFAWRTLIAAELVFGVSARSGGLGWYIFENRNLLETANVFAGLLTVIVIGLFVEGVIFRAIEARTVPALGHAALAMRIARAQADLHLYPLATPIRTAFGAMRARTMLLVRLEDGDGCVGWGEIWCNFPPGAGAARRRLFDDIFAPLLKATTFEDPRAAFATLEAKTRILSLQCGEPGTFAQVLAGIDQAMWDLSARRAGLPLWKHLGGTRSDVAVYASGLGPDGAVEQALVRLAQSYDGFKLKVGFAPEADLKNIAALRAALGPKAFIAVDANQAWDAETAARRVREFAPFSLGWIEEPLAVDAPEGEWQLVAGLSAAPIAGGENMRGPAQFREAIASNAFGVIQPDIAKWGGFTGCLAVGRAVREAGFMFCPHYLGGGVGLLASAHLLAAVGGDGRLEIDAQDNPLRDAVFDDFPHIRAGRLHLPDRPGLGYDPDPDLLKRYAEAA